MSYTKIKWLILLLPTVATGIWEYVRHQVLLPYLSMELGNVLTPFIVLLVTLTLLTKLFRMLEETLNQLQRGQAMKAAFEEREQLARELHDGISQSLFLMSVKLDKLERAQDSGGRAVAAEQIRATVRHVYEDVRQSIANLRTAPVTTDVHWMSAIRGLADEANANGIQVRLDWRLSDGLLTGKEQVELLAILRESVMNVRKHANANALILACEPIGNGFRAVVQDNGNGSEETDFWAKGRFGIRMMRDRAAGMGWTFTIKGSKDEGTTVEIVNNRGDGREK
ncbi:sensor histidine kinase [Paenibacillus sp. MMS18-CY102]|uniref:sensor histidine kinase n=1 Tax=Paenibacillus sp. MMS18-CY102 TaxID=2682849 RepID=UPI0013659D72|nr:histidine kinase [Paenibacillus sp. MMS18-CY102]MWC29016.1 sensor histidine kinase [Paenibacillus sp. MMS18-CY102]